MMRKKLFILGACFSFLIFSCSYELEDLPPSDPMRGDDFGIADARLYFEENATDLSYVHFREHHASTRANKESLELSPAWNQAVRSENEEAVLVEVPIGSDLSQISLTRYFDKGKFRFTRLSEIQVRLVVARRRNGETQMFIETLVPSAKYPNKEEDVKNFRYLGGGNFTGKVFCSTLEGHFVEASQYVKGKFIGMLHVTTRHELMEKEVSLEEMSYESVWLTSAVKTRSGGYSFIEEEEEEEDCPDHPGQKASTCPFCLDEVLVLACRYCGKTLEEGEVCDCRDICAWCGNNPCLCCPNCYCYPCICPSSYLCEICYPYPCSRCMVCGLHYCYGRCTSGGGGGGGNNTGPGNTILSNVDLIDTSKFVGYNVSKDCMKGCKDIMSNYGVDPGSSAHVYQLLFKRNGALEYYDTENYKTVYANAIACINRHLDAKRPIIVGVSHTLKQTINEGTTDHWIVIAGRGYDTTQKQYYYTYMETGRGNASDGCDTTKNRLYYDSKNYTFRDTEAGASNSRKYDVSQVRPNDGKQLTETIAQPTRNSN